MTQDNEKEQQVKLLENEIKRLKRILKKQTERTQGRVFGEDLVLFRGRFLVKSEYDYLSDFVETYCNCHLEDPYFLSENTSGIYSIGTLVYLPPNAYGPAFTLSIGDCHVIEMMVNKIRLGLPSTTEFPNLKKKFPKLEALIMGTGTDYIKQKY